MIVSQIAAMAKNRAIGLNNKLPWSIPEDYQYFLNKTDGHIVIMGRKTLQALGKPMANRLNIVVTRDSKFQLPGVIVAHGLEQALEIASSSLTQWPSEVFVIGGAEIYKQALPFTDKIYLTEIDQEFPGDAYFPEFDRKVFRLVQKSSRATPIPFHFCVYQKTLEIFSG